MAAPPPSRDDVIAVLEAVVDPELGADIVSLGMVPDVQVDADGAVQVTVKLTIGGCPLRADIKREIEQRVGIHPGVTDVRIEWGEMTPAERSETMLKARWNARQQAGDTQVPASTRIIAIASGKGGVGKSSVTVNLAVALARQGRTVGVLDADIWGFSVPRLLGITERMEAQRIDGSDRPLIVPNELPVGDGLLKVVSTGFLVDEDTALMWRGLMLTKAVEQFLRDVAWGELDDLLIDMPPGTGDVQMGLARLLPRADMVIVTTPGARRPEGRPAGRRHGPAQLRAGRRRGREHDRLHVRPRRALPAVRRRRRRRPGRRDRRPAARPGPARAGRVGRRRRRAPGRPRRRPGRRRVPRHRRRASTSRSRRRRPVGRRRTWPGARPACCRPSRSPWPTPSAPR